MSGRHRGGKQRGSRRSHPTADEAPPAVNLHRDVARSVEHDGLHERHLISRRDSSGRIVDGQHPTTRWCPEALPDQPRPIAANSAPVGASARGPAHPGSTHGRSGYVGRVAEPLDTDRVAALVEQGAQLLEVLPPSAFEAEHLPGAINITLPALDRVTASEQLDQSRPVVVYCYDTECDLSARGAALLEAYGFDEVYDYKGSKTEWLGYGHLTDGTVRPATRAGALADPSVATIGPDDPLTAIGEDARDPVVVLDERRVVLGTIDPRTIGSTSATAIDVLQPGPATVRPSITASELAASMDEAGQDHVLVSLLDGRFVGIIRRSRLALDA